MLHILASSGFCRACLAALCFLFIGVQRPLAPAADWSLGDNSSQDFDSSNARAKQKASKKPVGIPGEFERQAALVLSWKSEEIAVIGTLLEIGAHAAKKAPIVVLVSSPEEREHARLAFEVAKVNPRQVHFLEAPVDTIWARDFGPVVVRNADGSAHFVDSDYDDGDRPQDDNIPPVLAEAMGARCVRSLLSIEGGNLLSNGAGLCVTTSKTVADNVIRGYEHQQIRPLFRKMFQCQTVAVLEPLVDEPTGHVDMFVTFTAPDTVVVASLDPGDDPVNAAILDRNAQRLSELTTPLGPLQVERIPMPVQEEGLWRSYTNVLYFNGTLMMPTYAGVDPQMEQFIAETYRRLLPGWDVRGIDCTKLIRLGGAVHCVTLSLPQIKPQTTRRLPRLAAPAKPARGQNADGFDLDELPEVFLPQIDVDDSTHSFHENHPAPFAPGRESRRETARLNRPPMFAHPDKAAFAPDAR